MASGRGASFSYHYALCGDLAVRLGIKPLPAFSCPWALCRAFYQLRSLTNIDKEMGNLPLASTSHSLGKRLACDWCEDNSNTIEGRRGRELLVLQIDYIYHPQNPLIIVKPLCSSSHVLAYLHFVIHSVDLPAPTSQSFCCWWGVTACLCRHLKRRR